MCFTTIDGLHQMEFTNGAFRERPYMRLKVLNPHKESGLMNEHLEWTRWASSARAARVA